MKKIGLLLSLLPCMLGATSGTTTQNESETQLYKHTINGKCLTYGDTIAFDNCEIISYVSTPISIKKELDDVFSKSVSVERGTLTNLATYYTIHPFSIVWSMRRFVGIDYGTHKVVSYFTDEISQLIDFTDTITKL